VKQACRHLGEKSAFRKSGTWFNCCIQGNAFIDTDLISNDKRGSRHLTPGSSANRKLSRNGLLGSCPRMVGNSEVESMGPTGSMEEHGDSRRDVPIVVTQQQRQHQRLRNSCRPVDPHHFRHATSAASAFSGSVMEQAGACVTYFIPSSAL